MAKSTLHLCMSRLRDLKTAYGHAMPFAPVLQTAYGSGGSCINMLGPISSVAQGISVFVDHGSSVPISRGGPPILRE